MSASHLCAWLAAAERMTWRVRGRRRRAALPCAGTGDIVSRQPPNQSAVPSKWEPSMKLTGVMMVVAGTVVVGAYFTGKAVRAETADDRKWVSRCIQDNKDAKVSPDVVRKYCTCMNEAMDDNETRSITQFERDNPKIRAKCDRESGWK